MKDTKTDSIFLVRWKTHQGAMDSWPPVDKYFWNEADAREQYNTLLKRRGIYTLTLTKIKQTSSDVGDEVILLSSSEARSHNIHLFVLKEKNYNEEGLINERTVDEYYEDDEGNILVKEK